MFTPEDFDYSIDDMCSDAVRRLRSFQEGHFDIMQDGERYQSEVTRRDSLLGLIEYTTTTSTQIVHTIHNDLIRNDEPAEYLLRIIGSAVVALAENASTFRQATSIIIPSREAASSHVYEIWIRATNERETFKDIEFYGARLGSLGLTTLALRYGIKASTWSLDYVAAHSVSRMR